MALENGILERGTMDLLRPVKEEVIYFLPKRWNTQHNTTGKIVYLELAWNKRAVLKGVMGDVNLVWRQKTLLY